MLNCAAGPIHQSYAIQGECRVSVKLCVYLRDDQLPTRDAWQAAINAAGMKLTLDEFDARSFDGFLSCLLDGVQCGFEYYFSPLEEQDEEIRNQIGDSNRLVMLKMHGGEMIDLKAAMYAAAALTESSGGTFYDPQGDVAATGRGVYELMRQNEEHDCERGRLAAEKDAAFTDNRCPHCGAPCPTYRKTCKACGRSVRVSA